MHWVAQAVACGCKAQLCRALTIQQAQEQQQEMQQQLACTYADPCERAQHNSSRPE
jgi:hypothetical protein